MQIVGDELKKLIVSNENWDQTTEGIHISTKKTAPASL